MNKNFLLSVFRSGSGVLLSRIFGLIRDISIASVFGATKLTDTFFIAFAIPNLFRAFFAEGALSSAFIPILNDKFAISKPSAKKYLSDLIFVVSAIVVLIIVLFIIFSDYVILIFMPGYYNLPDIISQGSSILKIVMPYLLFVTACGLLSGYLYIQGSYFVPYSSTALLNIFMIFGAVSGWYYGKNIYYLAYGVFLGGMTQLIYIIYFSFKKGFRFKKPVKLDKDVKKTFYLILPSIAGVSINQINFTVGRVLASFLSQGSISYLYYANRILQLPLGIFSVTIGTVSLTELSKNSINNDLSARKDLIDNAVLSLFLFIVPATFGLYFLSEEIIKIIYYRNIFNLESMISTAIALKMYSIGLIFFSLITVLTKIFHAEKDIATPVKIGFICLIINIILNIILMQFFSHAGIALASSISSLVNAFLLYINLKSYSFRIKKHLSYLVKIFIASIAMLIVLLYLKYSSVHVIINMIICILVYFGSLYLMKINLKRKLF